MNEMYIFYIFLAIIGLTFVLMALPTILRGEIEKAAKKLLKEGKIDKEGNFLSGRAT